MSPSRPGRALALLLAVALLAACASPRPRVSASAAEQQLSAREAALDAAQGFALRGRIGVSNGQDAGSGQFEWRQQGAAFDFSLTVTVTGDRYRLHGAPGQVTLVDAEGRSRQGFDAETLLFERTGWRVPVVELGYWVRAMRAPGSAVEPTFAADGTLRTLRQLGWTLDYRGWTGQQQPPLPLRLVASKGEHRVRVAVREWQSPAPDAVP